MAKRQRYATQPFEQGVNPPPGSSRVSKRRKALSENSSQANITPTRGTAEAVTPLTPPATLARARDFPLFEPSCTQSANDAQADFWSISRFLEVEVIVSLALSFEREIVGLMAKRQRYATQPFEQGVNPPPGSSRASRWRKALSENLSQANITPTPGTTEAVTPLTPPRNPRERSRFPII